MDKSNDNPNQPKRAEVFIDENEKKYNEIRNIMIAGKENKNKDANKEDEEEQENPIEGQNLVKDKIVEKILKNFLIASESPFLEDINLILMMKALPSKIVQFNLDKMEMFNFNIL